MSIGYQKKTTAEIKKMLQAKFNHKFSVRRDHGTASRWIDVRWTDGPSYKEVNYFCGSFNDSSRDDIMTDLWCGSQYTNCHREISIGAYIWAVRKICDDYGKPYPEVKISGDSAHMEHKNDYVMSDNGGYQYLSNYVNRLLSDLDLRTIPAKDKEYNYKDGSLIVNSPGKYQYTTAIADMGIYRLNFNAAISDFENIKAEFDKKEAEIAAYYLNKSEQQEACAYNI
jgi:hypothetical protein